MVDKILSKDKNYNSHVSKVTEKEIKIEILRKDILALEEEYQKLKNDCKAFILALFIIKKNLKNYFYFFILNLNTQMLTFLHRHRRRTKRNRKGNA